MNINLNELYLLCKTCTVWFYISVLWVVATPVLPTPLRETAENCRAVLPHMTLLHRSISSLLQKMVSNLWCLSGMGWFRTKLTLKNCSTSNGKHLWIFMFGIISTNTYIHLFDSVANWSRFQIYYCDLNEYIKCKSLKKVHEKSQLGKIIDFHKMMFIRKSRRARTFHKVHVVYSTRLDAGTWPMNGWNNLKF